MTRRVCDGEPRRLSRRGRVVLLVLAGILVVAGYGPHLDQSTDDAFITYRYARNLAAGEGLVYNPGEARLGTTAAGWAMLLGAVATVSGPGLIPLASGVLSLAALLLAAWILVRRLGGADGLVFAVTLALVAGNRWLVEVLGHEGFARALMVVLALDLLERSRPVRSGFAWAAATVIRPDSGVMGAVAGLDEWRRRSRLPIGLLGGFVVGLGLGVLAVRGLAGALVPTSLGVKQVEAGLLGLDDLGSFWYQMVAWGWRCWGWGGPILVTLAVAGWWQQLRERPGPAVRLLLPALALLLVYPLLGVNFAPWYVILPVLYLDVGAATALGVAAQRWRWPVVAVVASLLVVASVPSAMWLARAAGEPPDPRAEPLRAAARWIDEQQGPDGAVAAVEVGFLGYATERPILDLLGLCSAGSIEALQSGTLPAFFLDRAPAYLVYNTAFEPLLRPLLADPRFRASYRLVWRHPPTVRHVTAVQVWRRVAVPSGDVGARPHDEGTRNGAEPEPTGQV